MGRADVTPGSTVGTYDVQGKLGATAWAETFVAASPGGEKIVALKVLDKEDEGGWEAVAAAKTKLESVANHLVLAIADLGIDEEAGVRFIATPLSDHPSLADLVDIYALAPAEAVALVKNLGIALDAAHSAGLPHLALKPSNVFVGPPPTYAVRLVDFGSDALRRAKKEPGPLTWLAPEQIDADGAADARADVFTVALLAFFTMTGKTYWAAGEEEKLREEIRGPRVKPSVRARAAGASLHAKLDDVLMKALGPAEERFDSARAFAEALEETLAEPPPREEQQRSSERHIKATLRLDKFRMPTLENTAPSGTHEVAPAAANVNKTQRIAPLRLPTPDRPPLPPPAPPPRRSSPSFPDRDAPPSTPAPPDAQSTPHEETVTDPAATTSAPIATPVLPEVTPPPRRAIYIPNRVLAVLAVAVTVLVLGVTVAALRKMGSEPLPAASAGAPLSSTETPGPPTSIVVPPPPSPEEPTAPDAAALGANESELDVQCTPACEKVMVDGKIMARYPAPLRLTPGRHGVGVSRAGYGGQYKLVFLKPAERQTVTFALGELKKK